MTAVTTIRLELAIETRWAVGAPDDASAEVDLPIRQRGADADLPSTGLAGALRRHLQEPDYWLGGTPPAGGEQRRKVAREASRLAFLGALPGERPIQTRGATAIDPKRRAAREKSLRMEHYAEATTVVVAMEHEVADADRSDALIDELAAWRPYVGRGRTTGMGRSRVSRVEWVRADLDLPEQLTWWLTRRHDWVTSPDSAPPPNGAAAGSRAGAKDPSNAELSLALTVKEPIHVGSREGADHGEARSTKAQSQFRSSGALTVPGSSWKGVFRSRVNSILEIIIGEEAPLAVRILFGGEDEKKDHHRGLLTFSDTPASKKTSPLTRTHVAIDRITGGARDSALFALESIPEGSHLTLRIGTTRGTLPPAVRNLLLHVVRDLSDGLIGIGGNVSRGYGWVAGDEPTLARCQPIDASALLREIHDMGKTS